MRKLRVNENKWTEYTKKLMKENPHWKCMEAGDKCNSVIRTMEEDWAWQDIVVATTRHSRTNDLTTSKALSRAIK